MRRTIAVVHNQPDLSKYEAVGEAKAILGVMDEVDAVLQALTELGHEVLLVPLRPPHEAAVERLRNLDTRIAFNLFEGFGGRPETEAEIAQALSDLGFAFTGCPSGALSLGLDKGRAKELLASGGVDTPRHQVLTPATLPTFRLTYPCVVKPCREDASHGVSEDSVVGDMRALGIQVEKTCRSYGGEALVEEFVGGREFNVTVLGNAGTVVLPVSEIEYSLPESMPRILTFAAKWEPESVYFEHTRAVCPADIPAELRQTIAEKARDSFRLLGCRGYARVDLRVDGEGMLKVLEVNPNPDISPGTGAARQAAASGMTYSGFIEKILSLALEPAKA